MVTQRFLRCLVHLNILVIFFPILDRAPKAVPFQSSQSAVRFRLGASVLDFAFFESEEELDL